MCATGGEINGTACNGIHLSAQSGGEKDPLCSYAISNYPVVNMNIDYLYVKPAMMCEVSSKICTRAGRCSDCPTALYLLYFDPEKVKRIIEEHYD